MSQAFKISFNNTLDEKSVSNNNQTKGDLLSNIRLYESDHSGRNICFIKMDGNRIFLSYSHLLSGSYQPDTSQITLAFSTHTVVLNGTNLDELYYQLMQNKVELIYAVDCRYNMLEEENKAVVNEIVVKEKD